MKKKDIPFVSVIVLNLNGGLLVENCLNSVLKTDYPCFEVILWDNGSYKKEQLRLKHLFAGKIKCIFKKKNYGFAQANNLAFRKTKGDYVVFLNNDTEVDRDWLKPLVKKMMSDSKIAFLQPKILSLYNRKFFNYHGAAGGIIDFLGYTFARGRVFDYVEKDQGQYDSEREIFWTGGVAMLVRRDVFRKLGGFDKRFFACQEEVDLCFRALRAGYKILVVPQSVVYHFGSVTLNRDLANRVFLNHRNQLFLLLKNLKTSELLWVLPLRVVLDFGAGLYYLYHRSFSLFLSVFKAYFAFILSFPGVIKTRVFDQIGNFGFPDSKSVYRGSLVFDYFVLKKRRYSEIMAEKIKTKIPICLSDKIKNFVSFDKRKARIIFLTWDTKKSGGNMRNFQYADILAKKGYRVKIFSICKPTNDWFLKVKFLYFWRYLIRFKKPDVLIATFWPTAYLALVLPAKKKVYFVRNWEADFYRYPPLSFLTLASLKLPFDKIITISAFLKKKIQKVNKKRKVYLVPNPIDSTLFKPGESSRKSSGKRVLIVVSRYAYFKGMDSLVKVVKELKKRDPQLRFVLISFEKTSYNVCFDEFISNPSQGCLITEYQSADVFLNTSLTEGFCLPPLEAMACGCSVVMTDSGGVREYAKHEYNCLIVKDIKEIFKKVMVKKILDNPRLRNKLIRNGLKTVKRFSWKKSISKLEKYLIN